MKWLSPSPSGSFICSSGGCSPSECVPVRLQFYGWVNSLPPACLRAVSILRLFRRFLPYFFCLVGMGPRSFVERSGRSVFSLRRVWRSPIFFQLVVVFPDSFLSFRWFPWLQRLRPNEKIHGPFLLQLMMLIISSEYVMVKILGVWTLSRHWLDWFPFVRLFCSRVDSSRMFYSFLIGCSICNCAYFWFSERGVIGSWKLLRISNSVPLVPWECLLRIVHHTCVWSWRPLPDCGLGSL